MKKTLKEIFSIREVTINVPDEHHQVLKKIINAAIAAGQLPPNSREWAGIKTAGVDTGASRAGKPIPASQDPKQGAAINPAANKSTPPPIPGGAKPPADPQASWDALGGPKATKPATAKAKAAPAAQKPVDPRLSWAAPPSANVQLGPEAPADDAPYKSPFNMGAIDPQGTRGTDMDVPDIEPGTYKTLGGQQPEPKGPGIAGRIGAGIKNAFKGKPSDGRKELDKALRAADKKATGKQGALSRIFKGRDVTKGQG